MLEQIQIYLTLRFFLFFTLIFSGWRMQKCQNSSLNFYVIFVTIIYSLIEGLRWMRGVDYWHYYQDLVTNFGTADCTPNPEFLYRLYVNITYVLGVPYYISFVFYSALLIYPLMLICKKYRNAAKWILPLFYVFTIDQSENLIRQYIAIGILLFAIYCYTEEKYKKMYYCLISVFLIHDSALLIIIPFLLWLKKGYTTAKPWWLLVLFSASFFLWKESYNDIIASHLGSLDVGFVRGGGYFKNADRWFTAEEGAFDNAAISAFNYAHRYLFNFFLIYVGFYIQLSAPKYRVFYYLAFIGIIIKTIGSDIEMYNRFYNWFIVFIPLIVGLTLSEEKNKLNYWALASLSMVYMLYGGIFRELNSINEYVIQFVWDK